MYSCYRSAILVHWCLALVVTLSEGFTVDTEKSGETVILEDGGYLKLVEWMKSHGGRVDPRMAIGKEDGIRGAMALSDIEEGAELLHCPWKLVIGSSGLREEDRMQDMCRVVHILADEFRLGPEGGGWPYLEHIRLPRLGAQWDRAAVAELQGLPPSRELNRHYEWFSKDCGGSLDNDADPASTQALVSFVSRASAVGMIPIYDLLNNHNGLKNAKLFLTEEGVNLMTVQPVSKGKQLYQSYGLKPSSHMFRDYGFVESWPALWSFTDGEENHVFASLPEGVAAIYPSPDFLREEISRTPPRSQSEAMREAALYTQSLPSEALIAFWKAAQKLLDGLPTTWQEDREILGQREAEARSAPEDVGLQDVIAAIQYRLTFKRSVFEALAFAEQTLKRADKEDL